MYSRVSLFAFARPAKPIILIYLSVIFFYLCDALQLDINDPILKKVIIVEKDKNYIIMLMNREAW